MFEIGIAPYNLFFSEDGNFREVAMVEILAQSAAAIKGYNDYSRKERQEKVSWWTIQELL